MGGVPGPLPDLTGDRGEGEGRNARARAPLPPTLHAAHPRGGARCASPRRPILARATRQKQQPRFFPRPPRDPPPSSGIVRHRDLPTDLPTAHDLPARPKHFNPRRARCGARQTLASHSRGGARRLPPTSPRADAARRGRRRDRLRALRLRVVPVRQRAREVRYPRVGPRNTRGAHRDAPRARLAFHRRAIIIDPKEHSCAAARCRNLRGVGRGRRREAA